MSGSTAKKHTLTYRTVRGLDIKLDYVLPPDLDDGESKNKEPVVVWFHGGGLLQGSREYPPPHLESAAAKHRVCVVSADYRLAPQTRLPEILSDLTSLFSYLVSPAFDSATKSRIDTSRIVTMGSSAGGWLSLLSGLNVGFEESGTRYEAELKDRVKGVVGIYPITSVEHEFWHTKQSRVSYYDRRIEKEELKTQLDPKSDEIANVGDNDERNKMYTYMIQEACLENLLLDGTGVDPSAFTVAKAIRLGKTVDPLPPIYLVHGTNDDKVPHAQSVEVVEALRERKKNGANELSFEYEEKQGLDHGYDYAESETMSEMWAWVVDKLDEK